MQMFGAGKVENDVIHAHLKAILRTFVFPRQRTFTLKLYDALSYPTPEDLRGDPEAPTQAVYPS